MTYIPQTVLSRWTKDAQNRNESLLHNLLELRDIITESKNHGDRILMEIYSEAAPAFNITMGALQNKLSVIREYSDEQIKRWIKKGIAIDTISRINNLSDADLTGGEAPADIIDRLLEQGNGEGKSPTADEAINHILEQNGIKTEEYHFNTIGSKFARRWGIKNVALFLKDLRELVNRHKS